MRRFIDLVESLSTELDWYWLDKDPTDACAVFKIDGRTGNVYFNPERGNGQPDRYDVNFEVDRTESITGDGGALRIFGTVIAIIEDFINMVEVQSLSFAAATSEPSRVKLYRALAHKLSPTVGMGVSEREDDYLGHDSVIFTLSF